MKSFWKLLRQVKEDKRQTLQNQHELPSLEKNLNYFKAPLLKENTRISSQGKSKH